MPERPLLTSSEAGALLWPDLSSSARSQRIYRWAHQGILPDRFVIRAGRSILIRRGAFMDWLGFSENGNGPAGNGVGKESHGQSSPP